METSDTYLGKKKKHDRTRNSKHACVFCEETFTNIAKHLQTHHKEPEVIDIKHFKEDARNSKDASEKRMLLGKVNWKLTLLRQKGDHEHNQVVKSRGYGTLLIARRSNDMDGFHVDNFHVCEDCHLWLHTSSNMAKHSTHCIAQNEFVGRGGAHTPKLTEKTPATATPSETSVTEALKSSFESTITKDPVGQAVLNDPLLMELGMYRAGENFGNETGKLKYARDRMRRLARLLLYMEKQLGRSCSMDSILTPVNFEAICSFAMIESKLMREGKFTNQETSTPHAARRIKEDVIKSLELKESLCAAGSQGESDARKLLQV